MDEHRQLKGVYFRKRKYYTKSLVKGQSVYQENIIKENNEEYREWNVKRSKLGAAVAKGVSQIGIKENSTVLYLGCATGTTVSHVSDIIGEGGMVFALDFAPRVMRELVFLAETRKNISPILGDAHLPKTYLNQLTEVDVVFQDIAQRDQPEIFLRNCRLFLKKGGFGLLAIKARSIDVTKRPKQIFDEAKIKLEKEMAIVDYMLL